MDLINQLLIDVTTNGAILCKTRRRFLRERHHSILNQLQEDVDVPLKWESSTAPVPPAEEEAVPDKAKRAGEDWWWPWTAALTAAEVKTAEDA